MGRSALTAKVPSASVVVVVVVELFSSDLDTFLYKNHAKKINRATKRTEPKVATAMVKDFVSVTDDDDDDW